MTATPAQRVEMIPIESIIVVNPRVRNPRAFEEIVNSIATIGLKRPVTVSRRAEADGPFYDLVCGQGRLEACRRLGHNEVPALVVSADSEDCLVASLVENLARRQHNATDLLGDIGRMRKHGYSIADIGRKTGLSYEYIAGVARLLERGEDRLLRAVESGMIPVSVAVDIAEATDADVQAALQRAYEGNLLRGRKLLAARRLIERRQRRGKGMRKPEGSGRRGLSPEDLVRAFEEDAERKRGLIRRSTIARGRLTFIVEALRTLFDDEPLVSLLQEEGLDNLPANIAARLDRHGAWAT